jgi:hypothetical protein
MMVSMLLAELTLTGNRYLKAPEGVNRIWLSRNINPMAEPIERISIKMGTNQKLELSLSHRYWIFLNKAKYY